MSKTAADVLVETLMDWGVDTIFGLPGDGINGVMEALRVRRDDIRFIQVRHEEAAAFMAAAYSKYTGKLGVCLATSGPGGLHLLNGLYDAKMDGQSVLAITGNTFHDLIDTFQQQDVNLDLVFRDVSVYSTRIMGPAHVESVTNLACRSALAYRGVAHINFPVDFQSMELSEKQTSKRNQPHHTSNEFAASAPLPAESELRAAADVLSAGQKVLILAGRGALHAGLELEEVAEKLGAPVAKALLGKAAVPDDSPYTTGGIGLLGTAPTEEAVKGCDTLLMVGTSFPYIEYLPEPGQARCVQIDLDPQRIGLRCPVEAGLVGDSKLVLQALLPMLVRQEDRSFLEEAQENMEDWWELMEKRGTRMDKPMKPQVVSWELSQLLDEDAIISADSGTITTWYARQIKIRRGQMCSLSGRLASMANGLPYAIAAQLAYPDRQCVAFVGDGGFTMLMGELVTAVKYDLPVKIIVIKNDVLGQIKWEQMVFLGNPEYEVELHPIDFAAFARAAGAEGYTIEDPQKAHEVLRQALSSPRPAVIQAVVDPLEPPLPGNIKPEQALKFVQSLVKGQPDRAAIIKTLTEDRVRQIV